MKISRITVKNFRLLKDISVDLEDELSLIIGKNNTGKTSLLLLLDKFLGQNASKSSFSFDDVNADLKDSLRNHITGTPAAPSSFPFYGISLKLFIEYDENDDLSNIGNKVIMDLDPANRHVVLAFEYVLTEDSFHQLKADFEEDCQTRQAAKKPQTDILDFLRDKHSAYFQLYRKSLFYDLSKKAEDEAIFTDLVKEQIQLNRIINFKWISARRNVSNKDSDRALSSLSCSLYKMFEAGDEHSEIIDNFKHELSNTDKCLDGIYANLFNEIIEDVKKFGGSRPNESNIRIVSSLQHQDLLEQNTTVMYGLDDSSHSLPENYNGLGYMNLICMILEIKKLMQEFKKGKNETPSDINLLFIEEPEAHTHPQMQYIFIRNIKSLLQAGIQKPGDTLRKLQTIISTHSSHIVSESSFDDIKYLKKEGRDIISKNLKDLEQEYADKPSYYKFLRQYLTLNRAELFFADKVIFIEGDTERILLPAMMKKLDQETPEGSSSAVPLLSQNISVIEVGNYSHIFEQFIDFIGIKSLIITDIDPVKEVLVKDENGEVKKNADGNDKTKSISCCFSEGKNTCNYSLIYFYGQAPTLDQFKEFPLSAKTFRKSGEPKRWVQDSAGTLACLYQTQEADYCASSFEDAFFHINRDFIANNDFQSLTNKHLESFKTSGDAYALATIGVLSKPSLAMEILLNSKADETGKCDFSNWAIPAYIKEGLLWLKAD